MKKLALVCVLAGATLASAALTWDNVELATNGDSLRTFLVADPATETLYFSDWSGDFTVHSLGKAAATNYGVTTAGDWGSYAAPANFGGGWGDDPGTGATVVNGKLYAFTGLTDDAEGKWRRMVRMDTTTGAWEIGLPSDNGRSNFGVQVYDDGGTVKYIGRHSGSRDFLTGAITEGGLYDFDYGEEWQSASTGYWGGDGTIGGGYYYLYEQGINGGLNQLRRGSLAAADVKDELVVEWANAQGPANDNHNRHANVDIEYIPAADAPSGSAELWVLPTVWAGDEHQHRIDRYDAATGAFIDSEALPFDITNIGQGYEMEILSGTIFITQRDQGEGAKLWSAVVPEPASLLLIGLAGALIRRR